MQWSCRWSTHALDEAHSTLYPDAVIDIAREEVELLQGAGEPFCREKFLEGRLTPVFFGSALTNYGVEQFLEGFIKLAPPPLPRISDIGPVSPANDEFTAMVFKIQANLDPRHRDRVAYVRVCSGLFRRDMEVQVTRTGETVRVPRSHQLFASERETVEEAYPGDIIGLVNPGKLRLGDTLCSGKSIQYEGQWEYTPECFVRIRCTDSSKRKQFTRGLEQLIEEGAIQLLSDEGTSSFEPVLAAVGALQFDVVQFRLASEYQAQTTLEHLPYTVARWVDSKAYDAGDYLLPAGSRTMVDHHGARMLLFANEWYLDYFRRNHPALELLTTRPPHEH